MKCAVANCSNNTFTNKKQLSFFSFPKNARLAKKWELFCGNPIEINPKTAIICSQHFISDEIIEDNTGTMNRRRLKAGAVPCIEMRPSKKATKKKESNKMEGINTDDANCTKLTAQVKEEPELDESKDDDNAAEQKEVKNKKEQMDDILDMECYQAVIDELTNQNEALRLENLRVKVNMQLVQKKCKIDYKQSEKELEQANFQIQQLEKVLSTLCSSERVKKIKANIDKLWKQFDSKKSP